MKYLTLSSYLLTINFVIVYFYYRIGVLKMLATLTLEELNEEQEFAEEKLEASDFNWIRNFFVSIFSLLGVYLWALVGTTFGAIAKEMATTSMTLQWILYPTLFIMMGILFSMAHRMIKVRFEIEENIQENIFFIFSMLTAYVLVIVWPEWISAIFSWPVRLVLS